MKNKNGFTLIELLAVIVIIAIIATIGVFAVTKIMDKSRMDSLKNTALAVKKAAKLYAASNELSATVTPLNMTPITGSERNLIDLGKDPWGKDYEQVLATITKESNDAVTIDVYIQASKATYALTEVISNSKVVENYDANATIPNEVLSLFETSIVIDPDIQTITDMVWWYPGTATSYVGVVADPDSINGQVFRTSPDRVANAHYVKFVTAPNIQPNTSYNVTAKIRGDASNNGDPSSDGAFSIKFVNAQDPDSYFDYANSTPSSMSVSNSLTVWNTYNLGTLTTGTLPSDIMLCIDSDNGQEIYYFDSITLTTN